jgi:hypothetical protein
MSTFGHVLGSGLVSLLWAIGGVIVYFGVFVLLGVLFAVAKALRRWVVSVWEHKKEHHHPKDPSLG